MGCRTFQSHHRTILMRPLQELLISCQLRQSDLTLFLASPRKRRPTRNGSGIVPSVAPASVRVKVDGRSAKTLVRIVVRSRSVKDGIVSGRTKRVQTRGRRVARGPFICAYAHHLISRLFSSWLRCALPCFVLFCLFHVCMHIHFSLAVYCVCFSLFSFVISPAVLAGRMS